MHTSAMNGPKDKAKTNTTKKPSFMSRRGEKSQRQTPSSQLGFPEKNIIYDNQNERY
jgi:hypothetical protein